MPSHDWWLSLQDNEDVNLDIAHSLYATAKELDPSRPVNTADGVWCVYASAFCRTVFAALAVL